MDNLAETLEKKESLESPKELKEKARKIGVLFYKHGKAMGEAEKIIAEYAEDPYVYIQDKQINHLCHIIMRLWWSLKNNYAPIETLTEAQKWKIYYEMKRKIKDSRAPGQF